MIKIDRHIFSLKLIITDEACPIKQRLGFQFDTKGAVTIIRENVLATNLNETTI